MMRKRIAVSCLLLASVLWAGSAMAEGTIALFLGQKSLDDARYAHDVDTPPARGDGWSPVEDQAEIGINLSAGRAQWPVLMAVDLMYSEGDDTDDTNGKKREAWTVELGFGVRKFWSVWGDNFRPFVSGGLVTIKHYQSASAGGVQRDDDNLGTGWWVDGGFLWPVHKKLSLGLDLRYSSTPGEIRGVDVNPGGSHVGFLLGWDL
jgi:hypothetical protein